MGSRAKNRKNGQFKMDDRRRQVAELYLAGASQCESARQLGVCQATVCKDLAAVREEFFEVGERVFGFEFAKGQARLSDLRVTLSDLIDERGVGRDEAVAGDAFPADHAFDLDGALRPAFRAQKTETFTKKSNAGMFCLRCSGGGVNDTAERLEKAATVRHRRTRN